MRTVNFGRFSLFLLLSSSFFGVLANASRVPVESTKFLDPPHWSRADLGSIQFRDDPKHRMIKDLRTRWDRHPVASIDGYLSGESLWLVIRQLSEFSDPNAQNYKSEDQSWLFEQHFALQVLGKILENESYQKLPIDSAVLQENAEIALVQLLANHALQQGKVPGQLNLIQQYQLLKSREGNKSLIINWNFNDNRISIEEDALHKDIVVFPITLQFLDYPETYEAFKREFLQKLESTVRRFYAFQELVLSKAEHLPLELDTREVSDDEVQKVNSDPELKKTLDSFLGVTAKVKVLEKRDQFILREKILELFIKNPVQLKTNPCQVSKEYSCVSVDPFVMTQALMPERRYSNEIWMVSTFSEKDRTSGNYKHIEEVAEILPICGQMVLSLLTDSCKL